MTNEGWGRVRGALLTVTFALAAACACPGLGKPPLDSKGEPPAPTFSDVAYRLNRTVYRIDLTRVPLARTRCWVTEKRSADLDGGAPPATHVDDAGAAAAQNVRRPDDQQVVEWDPNSKTSSPVRRVALRGSDATLRCSAEIVAAGGDKESRAVSYSFHECAAPDAGEPGVLHLLVGKMTEAFPLAPAPDGGHGRTKEQNPPSDPCAGSGAATGSFDVEVRLRREQQTDPDLAGDDAAISVNRSLDPLTPLVTELVSVIADVAIDRAKAGATAAIKDTLNNTVCKVAYASDRTSDLSERRQAVPAAPPKAPSSQPAPREASGATGQAPLPQPIVGAMPEETPQVPSSQPSASASGTVAESQREGVDPPATVLVFSRVCKALDAVRIEELAASSKVLARALAGDIAEYAFRSLRSKTQDPLADGLLGSLEQAVSGLIEGKTISTERDFQAMLLKLGKLPVTLAPNSVAVVEPSPKTLGELEWRCGVGIGLAVVRECLRRDRCTAEALESSLNIELEEPSDGCRAAAAGLRNKWPDLGPLLARAIDVFRPPPGTPANQTAKTATNVLFDVLQRRPNTGGNSSVFSTRHIEQIRGLVNAIFDKDYVAGVTSAGGLLTDAIQGYCDKAVAKGERCFLAATSEQVKKGVALLNGFVSYASTYQDNASNAADGKSDAEREKIRHDERKKAMEALIDSTTDRSNRGGDCVVSAGVGVGLNAGRVPRSLNLKDAFWSPALSLPMGFALQCLPKGKFGAGLHVQLTLLDLGQYANLNGDATIAKPEIATAAVLGGQLGILLGSSKFALLLGVDFGYAPGLKFSDSDSPGVWRFGGFAGTYVPFFDFN